MAGLASAGKLTPSQVHALYAFAGREGSGVRPACHRIPAWTYTDPDHFLRERHSYFARYPLAICPSAALARSSIRRTRVLDRPLLLTRAADGKARAFLNACRHRGTLLCTDDGTIEGKRVTCPFHAWTYALDGKLIGVPRQEVFSHFDRTAFGLVELPCREAGGLVWVGLEADSPPDFSILSAALIDDLDAFDFDNCRVFAQKTYEVPANWKLIMDGMLDSYHVTRLHRNSLARFFGDTHPVIDVIGTHVRSVTGTRGIETAKISDDERAMREVAAFHYCLFPAGIVTVSGAYTSVGIIRPIAHDRTVVDLFMLIPDLPLDGEAEDKMSRSFALMDVVFGEEDFWAAGLGQSGLASSALDMLLLGGLEEQMQVFHTILDDRL